jgi:hypothetical protein
MRRPIRLLVMAAMAQATLAAPGIADAQPPPPPPEEAWYPESEPQRIRNGFSAKVGLGPNYRSLHGHDIWGARFSGALGAQFKDWGAVHGEFAYEIGAIESGLKTESASFGPTWEFVIDRLRLGLGGQMALVWVERATYDASLFGGGYGFNAFMSYDLISDDHVNLYLALDGRYSWLDDDLGYGGLGLTLGTRFKTP